jgi:tryptophan synthase alpha chain
MNRIVNTFQELQAAGRKGLVGYLTAGDPDEATSERHVLDAVAAGVDVIELGVPFSDPTADGPVIQAAARRALAAGITVSKVLALVARLRKRTQVPIVLFGYANPFLKYGYAKLCADAAAAGADGLLVVDLPFEESDELREHMKTHGLLLIPLIAPTTPVARAAELLRDAGGFVYYIMVRGVTGARAAVALDLDENLRGLRSVTRLPIAVGFGVSSGPQARQAADKADAVVIGSALVKAAGEGRLVALVKELRGALG